MKFDHSFKHYDVSQALMSYVEEKMEKLEKYEIKPGTAHITYSMEKRSHNSCCVEIHLVGGDYQFKAHYKDADWHKAAEQAVGRLLSQMKKHKSKVKYHKHPEKTKYAKLRLLNSELETDYTLFKDKNFHKKAG